MYKKEISDIMEQPNIKLAERTYHAFNCTKEQSNNMKFFFCFRTVIKLNKNELTCCKNGRA